MKPSSVGYAVLVSLVLAACGGDDGAKSDSATKDKGAAGKSASGKSAPCGTKTCTLPAELKDEMPCCADNFNAVCGVITNAQCRALPKIDERCPVPDIMVMVPGGNTRAFGCCTSAGECGIDFGMGCQPRTIACMVVTPDQVGQVKPQKCTGEALPVPSDCGMSGFRPPNFAGSGG